ncbi:proton-conducting transporter membrane subunit [Agrococcus sp. ProA11]|uniref:NADH-quinone oxidoreductase subunit 5 family protein n=1 Tax=Agrococcus chionoecetis TaxID=3153752 RepID=UPI003260746A
MSPLLLALIALPAAAGVGLLLGGRRADRIAPATSIAVTALALIAAIAAAVTRPMSDAPFIVGSGATLAVDGLSAVLLPTIATVALLVLIIAVAERTEPEARFHGLMLVFVAAVFVTVTSTSLVSLLAAWEIMGATSYALIGFHWRSARAVPAGLVAFSVTRAADIGLYLAAGVAVIAGVGWQLDDLRGAPEPWLSLIAAGVLIAGLGKAAQLPFSFWLSRAMEGPSPVSALLHSAAMVAMGGYLLLRLSPLLLATEWAGWAAAWIGAATAIVLGVVAVAQTDLKQLLAASTAAQLGFVALAAGIGATASGTAQLIAHASTKALLFLVAGLWLAATGTKQLQALRGVGRRWPLVGVTFLIGALALAGIPPLSLWLTKDAVLAGALEASPALYAAGLVGAVLSAAYSAKIIAVAWAPVQVERRETGWDHEHRGTRRVPAAALGPLVILAIGATVLGVLAAPGLDGPFRAALGVAAQPHSTIAELIASAVLAVIVGLIVLRYRLPGIPGAAVWFGLERAAAGLVGRPTEATAAALARFDSRLDALIDRSPRALQQLATRTARSDELLDAAVDRSPRALDRAGRSTRSADGGVDAMVSRVVSLTRLAARGARRSQTGRIADYYAVGAVAAAAFIVLLIVVR